MLREQKVADVVVVQPPGMAPYSWLTREDALPELLAYPTRLWLALDVGDDLPRPLISAEPSFRLIPLLCHEIVHSSNVVKRVFDIGLATILLALFCPLIATCAMLVRASGPGPIIFRQKRVGAHGRIFTVLKFRTMFHQPELAFSPAIRNDPRITSIGRFLRRTALDELLQLVNVLRGEMS
ncbi:MAG: hypothetical protein B7Z80_22610, partial [Rhodospirillales bacterium 20-64-7]